MRILSTNKDYSLSCGILLVTGFGEDRHTLKDKDRMKEIILDLKDLDGHLNKYTCKRTVYNWEKHASQERVITSYTERAAFMLVSLNRAQAKVYRPILIKHGYREIVEPTVNPNSGRNITIFVRQRKPKPAKRKKKVKKEVQV